MTNDDQLAILLLAGILGMVLFALAIIAFVVVYQRRLLAQRESLNRLEQEKQRELLASSLRAQENERKRIAQDLHDSVGGQLSATKLFLGRLPSDGDGDIPRIKRESQDLIDETIHTIRRISQNLLPPNLDNFGLVAALEDLGHVLQRSDSIRFRFTHNEPPRFASEKEVALFRIVQELINNTLKHADASTITLRLRHMGGHLELVYADDGKGFAQSNGHSGKANSLGMQGIAGRIQMLNGNLRVESQPGAGVEVHINVPLYTADSPPSG